MSFFYKSENIHAFVLKPEMETFGIKSEFSFHYNNICIFSFFQASQTVFYAQHLCSIDRNRSYCSLLCKSFTHCFSHMMIQRFFTQNR